MPDKKPKSAIKSLRLSGKRKVWQPPQQKPPTTSLPLQALSFVEQIADLSVA